MNILTGFLLLTIGPMVTFSIYLMLIERFRARRTTLVLIACVYGITNVITPTVAVTLALIDNYGKEKYPCIGIVSAIIAFCIFRGAELFSFRGIEIFRDAWNDRA